MAISAFIHFNGNCRKAVGFYAKVFGIEKPVLNCYGDLPHDQEHPRSCAEKKRVAFTYLTINEYRVCFSDCHPDLAYEKGNDCSLMIIEEDVDKLKRLFASLRKKGTVWMELQKTAWSECFGSLTDKFGVQWHFFLDNKGM